MTMAHYLIRSAVLKKVSCNMRNSVRNHDLVTINFSHFNSKPPKISNLVMQQRSHYWVTGLFGKQSELTLKHLDKVPNDFKVIYRNDDVDVHLKWMYLSAFITAGIILGMVVFKIDVESSKLMADKKPDPVQNEALKCLFAFTLCYLVFYAFVKRMPVRIYKVPKQEEFIFVFNSAIPLFTRKLTCRKGEFVKFDSVKYRPLISEENNTLYRILNKQIIILFEDGFKIPAHLHILLGQQKDYDD